MVFSITSVNSTQAKTNVSNKTQSFPDDKTLKKAAEQLGISVEQLKENLTQSRVAKNKGIYNLAVTVNEMDMKAFCILNGIDYNDWRNHNADSNRMYYVIKNPNQYKTTTNSTESVNRSTSSTKSKTTTLVETPTTSASSAESSAPARKTNTTHVVSKSTSSNSVRSYYIDTKDPVVHTVKRGDIAYNIAKKYGVSPAALEAANPGINLARLSIGQKINIPAAREIKMGTVNKRLDVANAMGVDEDFIQRLTDLEVFRNDVYKDGVGVPTIGIGHAIQNSDDRKFLIEKYGERGTSKLSNAQVWDLLARDLLEAEENIAAIIGQDNYDRLPTPLKGALLDMVLNKGKEIITETDGLAYCLKEGKYEAAINKFTHIKTITEPQKELAGLAKRRLFDISVAIKMYNGEIPDSNIATARKVYNRGVELLKKEYPNNFENQLEGYNNDIKSYFGEDLFNEITGTNV